jgi:hypothetical protein
LCEARFAPIVVPMLSQASTPRLCAAGLGPLRLLLRLARR